MQARAYDFRDEVPLWVRYAEYIGNGSDKYYEVRVDMADDGIYVLTKRWGARPDVGKGQVKTQAFTLVDRATQAAIAQLNLKIQKGYIQCERPLAANQQVEQDWSE